MKKIVLFFLFLFAISKIATAQLTANGAGKAVVTQYTNISPNDTIYVFCSIDANGNPNMGSLTATPVGGMPNYNFDWQKFNPNTYVYDPFTNTNGLTSTINNLGDGGYNVTITDANGNKQCMRAWVYIDSIIPKIDPIIPRCDTIKLNATIGKSAPFTYYDPPATSLLIDSNTTITVCFDALHTFVSDLGFFLIGPPSCLSPTICLANPIAANNGGLNCNSGNDVIGLCFTTSSGVLFNGCVPAPAHTLSGTYASNNPWNPIYGCDAATAGWTVQVYDCVGADVGSLTHASISFSGQGPCGPTSIFYDSGIINSIINDNSCLPGNASVFIVPPGVPATHVMNLPPATYLWTSNPPTSVQNFTDSLNPEIYGNLFPQQDVWFYLEATDSLGVCTKKDSTKYTFTILQATMQFADDTCGMGEGKAKVTVTGGTPPYTYAWDDAQAQTADSAINLPMGAYNVLVTDSNHCTVAMMVQIVTIPLPIAEFFPTPEVISLLDPVCLFVNKSKNAIKYWWNFGDGDTSTSFNPKHSYVQEGTYEVKLVVENQYGCRDSITHTVIVESYFTFYIPNAFRPNTDGLNDEFIPKIFGVINDGYDFSVFNRWGTEIFHTNDPLKGWSGNVDGGTKNAMNEVYVYVIKFTDFKLKKHSVVGHVTLVQ